MGHKHAAKVIKTGRGIPSNLETCLREGDAAKAKAIADPTKIDKAYHMVFDGALHRIETEERTNWYFWAKPRGHRTSPEVGAERAFKEFYKGEPLTPEEKNVVLSSLAINIEEELNELKKERDAIKR